MAGRRVLARSAVVNDLDAELGCVAEDCLKLGGDRRVVGTKESGRGKGGRRRGGEKLNDERQRDEERGQRQAAVARAKLRPRRLPLPFGATHADSPLRPERNACRRVAHWRTRRNS